VNPHKKGVNPHKKGVKTTQKGSESTLLNKCVDLFYLSRYYFCVMNMKITKSNAIINSSYRFSLNELRIVLYGLSHIDPTTDDFPLFHRIHIKELAEFYNIGDKDRGSFYDNIREALVTKFWEREFSYFDEERKATVKRRWLIEVEYGAKNGSLAYHYNPLIKNQLQKLAKRFTSYFLSNVSNMKSAYSMRIYEVAVMYLNASGKSKTTFNKNIEDLKQQLDISEKYKHFYHMKSRVLEHARKEINKHSDINIIYKIIKLGRSPNEIEFTVSRKAKTQSLPALTQTPSQKLTPSIFEKAKKIALEAGTGWDIYSIEQQFYEHIRKKGPPDSLELAFLGFVKKKVINPP